MVKCTLAVFFYIPLNSVTNSADGNSRAVIMTVHSYTKYILMYRIMHHLDIFNMVYLTQHLPFKLSLRVLHLHNQDQVPPPIVKRTTIKTCMLHKLARQHGYLTIMSLWNAPLISSWEWQLASNSSLIPLVFCSNQFSLTPGGTATPGGSCVVQAAQAPYSTSLFQKSFKLLNC